MQKFHESLPYLEKSLKLSEQYENPFYSADTLYYLALSCYELNLIEKAENFLEKLKEIGNQTENKLISLQIKIIKGIIFKKSSRVVIKSKAQEIFQQISEEKMVDIELHTFSLLNLLELLVWELSSTGDSEVLQEIKKLIIQLDKIAEDQQSSFLKIEILIIESQLELVQGNLGKTEELLDQAKKKAVEKKLDNHLLRIENQEKQLVNEITKWKKLTEENAPLISRIQESKIIDYIVEAQRYIDKGSSQSREQRTLQKINIS
ncbi:MAG: tetratricopeptide repeat protein [Candidatus Hodarchaeales archaeon]